MRVLLSSTEWMEEADDDGDGSESVGLVKEDLRGLGLGFGLGLARTSFSLEESLRKNDATLDGILKLGTRDCGDASFFLFWQE
jgi:hypothetical protein